MNRPKSCAQWVFVALIAALAPACFTANAVVQRERVRIGVQRLDVSLLDTVVEGDQIELRLADGTVKSFGAGTVAVDDANLAVLELDTGVSFTAPRIDVASIELETFALVRNDAARAVAKDYSLPYAAASLVVVAVLVLALFEACSDGCLPSSPL